MSFPSRVMLALVAALLAAMLATGLVVALGWVYWQTDGVTVFDDPDYQIMPDITFDGSGGGIITWKNSGDSHSLRAQRIADNGDLLWVAGAAKVSAAAEKQYELAMAPDGSGGTVITWEDERDWGTTGADIYVQRVDSSGDSLWATDGVSICTAANNQRNPQIVPDGSGGAIVAWDDGRPSKYGIYAQRVDANGNTLWAADGVSLCNITYDQADPRLCSDGSGGAIVTWRDRRNITYWDIYAQHVDADGNRTWTSSGVPICTVATNQLQPHIASDGSGGAIVTWEDYISGVTADIYAQRIDVNGSTLWASNGVSVCAQTGQQGFPKIIPDGSGGAFVTWEDHRASNGNIYAQRIDANGNMLWTTDGVPVCVVTGSQYKPQITPDLSGGAIVTWRDSRSGTDSDIYAQRVYSDGNTLWTSNGVSLCTAAQIQKDPQLRPDGSGGAIVTWTDSRGASYDIYAQRVDSGGNTLWTTDGISLCVATNGQSDPRLIMDSYGGVIVAWEDNRFGSDTDIYAQRVDANGNTLWDGPPQPARLWSSSVSWSEHPRIVSDWSGGAVVAWQDSRNDHTTRDLYAQRVDGDGNTLWAEEGVSICLASWDQIGHQLCPDSANGAIVTWEDYRVLGSVQPDIYAQRVGSNGNTLWTADGISISTATGDHRDPQITLDGSGGAIVTWSGYNSTGGMNIYAQRVDSDGNTLWHTGGVTVCGESGGQHSPQIIGDWSGGAFIAWSDGRGSDSDIYVQRLDSSGNASWAANGVPLCAATDSQSHPRISSDWSGGAIVTWEDLRSGSNDDIYAQRVDGSGNALWSTDGISLCVATDWQGDARITPDLSGGAIVAWEDLRSGSIDIYAQRVDASGNVLWDPDGVAVCSAADHQHNLQLIFDTTGGAIITWRDDRGIDADIYAQRVGSLEEVSLPLVAKSYQ